MTIKHDEDGTPFIATTDTVEVRMVIEDGRTHRHCLNAAGETVLTSRVAA